MAYNPYLAYPNPYMMPPQQTPQMESKPIQNGSFIAVPSEHDVLTYPVAPGNCMTFKIEGKPVVMEKSMGFSQLESPKIKKYKLVEEAVAQTPEMPKQEPIDLTPINTSIGELKDEIKAIWSEIETLKNPPKKVVKKKEVEDDTE